MRLYLLGTDVRFGLDEVVWLSTYHRTWSSVRVVFYPVLCMQRPRDGLVLCPSL